MITSWWSMCRWLYSFKLNNNVLVCFFSFSFSFGIFHKYSQDALSSQKPVAAIFYFLFFFLCLPSLHQNFVYRYSIIRAFFFFFLFLSRLKSSIHHYSLPLYVYSLIIIKTFFFFSTFSGSSSRVVKSPPILQIDHLFKNGIGQVDSVRAVYGHFILRNIHAVHSR